MQLKGEKKAHLKVHNLSFRREASTNQGFPLLPEKLRLRQFLKITAQLKLPTHLLN